MALLDEGAHIAEEEGEHQGADVRAVHIGIGHDEHFVIPQLGDIKLFSDAAAQSQHHRHQLVVAIDAVGAGLFHVEHLAPQWEDGLNGRVTAHLGRAACRIALDDEDLGTGGVFFTAVRQFSGHPAGLEGTLAAHQLTGLLGGGAGAGGLGGLFKDGLCHAGVLLEELHQLGVDHIGDEGANFRIAQLGLGLALELSLLQLHGDDADEALADVSAGEVLVLVLQQTVAAAIIVEDAGQAAAEAFFVGAAVGGVDVVGEAQHQLIVAGIILQSDLCHAPVGLTLEVDDIRVEHFQIALLAQIGDKALDAALIAHDLGAIGGLPLLTIFQHGGVELPLIGQGDLDTGVQEALFPQALFQRLEVVDGGVLEHLGVRLEGDAGAGHAGVHGADALERACGVAPVEGLFILMAVAADVDSQPLRAGVDDRSADAVQTTGHLIAGVLTAELATGVEDGVDNSDSGQAGICLDIHRDAAAIIRDLNDVAFQNFNFDVVAVTCQSLIDGVIHDLVHQMVQAALTGGADIHTGALAHRLQTLQDLDLAGVVFMVRRSFCVGTGNDFLCHFLSPFCFVISSIFYDKSNKLPVGTLLAGCL